MVAKGTISIVKHSTFSIGGVGRALGDTNQVGAGAI